MADFKKLRSERPKSSPTDPLRIFQRLPKPEHINDLWDSQSEALKLWYERRTENDLVIKLNTGGGKTLVGLLIGQSLMNELRQPVLYLCPNNQLVGQTIQKATEVGIAALAYERGPGDLPAEFLNGSRIMVASYAAVFHGRSKFGVLGSGNEPIHIGGVICDDAHAAFSAVRDAFTLSVSKKEHQELYSELTTRFRSDFNRIGKMGTFDDIVERGDLGVLEIPYTSWASQASTIRELLARQYADEFKYHLPVLRDYFDSCHALISSRDFSITAIQPLIRLFPTFEECKRRVYMSATIADDSSIIRTFDAKAETVSKPIIPETLAGVGERLILAPALMNLAGKEPQAIAGKLAETVAGKGSGAVILVPSEAAASKWENVAEFVIGNADVERAIDDLLEERRHGPFVFANRYDGMDLVGNACRLLVIDGLPRGANTYEIFRAEVLRASSSLNISLAQKVEQGMGRATRGAGDYCVVILTGSDLVGWITRTETLGLMTPSTRAQVLMGHELSRSTSSTKELLETINQCLKRDPEWTRYHAETLADRAEAPRVHKPAIQAASVEREYLEAFMARQFYEASEIAAQFANQHQSDRRMRGWFLQLAARARYYAKDTSGAENLQKEAFRANSLLWAPTGIADLYEAVESVGDQAENILSAIAKFALPGGHLADFEDAVVQLTPAASSNQLEESLKRLGAFLGFHSERPEQEYGVGPDVLWLPNADIGIIIESKLGKKPKKALGKEDHGQLLVSAEWFKEAYPARNGIRVQVHPNVEATAPSMAKKTYVLTYENMGRITSALRSVLTELCFSHASPKNRLSQCRKLLEDNHLTPSALVGEYFTLFKVVASK